MFGKCNDTPSIKLKENCLESVSILALSRRCSYMKIDWTSLLSLLLFSGVKTRERVVKSQDRENDEKKREDEFEDEAELTGPLQL